MYIQSSDRFLLVFPAMSPLHVSPHCQPRIWGQCGFPSAYGWKAARLVCRVEASLWITPFQDLTVKFLVLLLARCLTQKRWLPQTCSWHCCWIAYFTLGSRSIEPPWPWRCPSLWSRESPHPDHQGRMAVAPVSRATDSHCSYPNFSSVLWISAS